MQTLITVLLWFCALGCALLGGLYFAFSAFIMTALRDMGAAGVTAMNSINRVILRSWFMPLFFGTTLGSAGLVVVGAMGLHEPRAPYLVAGGVLYVLGMFVVTMLFNVPLNNALQNVTQESRTGMAIWGDYLRRWTLWNHVRTVSCLGAAALFIIGIGSDPISSWQKGPGLHLSRESSILDNSPGPSFYRGYSVCGISAIESNDSPLAFAASSIAA